jgi:hypothetical protein
MLARLRDSATRERIKKEISEDHKDWENIYLGSGGAGGVLIGSVVNRDLESSQGKRVSEIAEEQKKDPLEALRLPENDLEILAIGVAFAQGTQHAPGEARDRGDGISDFLRHEDSPLADHGELVRVLELSLELSRPPLAPREPVGLSRAKRAQREGRRDETRDPGVLDVERRGGGPWFPAVGPHGDEGAVNSLRQLGHSSFCALVSSRSV